MYCPVYNLINATTNEVVAYTYIAPFCAKYSISTEEILAIRLKIAIDKGKLSNGSYEWIKGEKGLGVTI